MFAFQSGLTQAVRNSQITLEQAEYEFLSFVRQHSPPGQCPLAGKSNQALLQFHFVPYCDVVIPAPAGNSVHADKRFLDKYMPQFMHHLHYRIIDVSTIKELCRSVLVKVSHPGLVGSSGFCCLPEGLEPQQVDGVFHREKIC